MISESDIQIREEQNRKADPQIKITAELHLSYVESFQGFNPDFEEHLRRHAMGRAHERLWHRLYGNAFEELLKLEKELARRMPYETPEGIRRLIGPLHEMLKKPTPKYPSRW
ncbi:MAG: hypothetical protein JWM16_3344 [Verrucomicrobiales bacterium]|nr:hypothetical protein [Verrucomicrobiales bacterium]